MKAIKVIPQKPVEGEAARAHRSVKSWVDGPHLVISGPLVRTVMVSILEDYHEGSLDILEGRSNKPEHAVEPSTEELSTALSLLLKGRERYSNPEILYAIEALTQNIKE